MTSPADLRAEARRLEAALDRFRVWRNTRAQEEAALIAQLTAHRKLTAEEAALIAQLTAHRKLTAQGVAKADQLSAKLSGIRLQLSEER